MSIITKIDYATQEEQKEVVDLEINTAKSSGPLSNPNELILSEYGDESKVMNPEILCSLRAGDKESLIERISNNGLDFQQVLDKGGNSILHLAAALGHINIVEYTASNFCNLLDKKNLIGETALHVAAKAGNLSVVEFLVKCTGGLLLTETISNNGDTSMHAALKGNHAVVASYLVNVRHDVSFKENVDEVSPLYLAVEAGYSELVEKMLECSCCTSKFFLMLSNRSVVHAAIRTKRIDILGIVLSQDPRLIELRNEEGRTCLSLGPSIGFYEGIRYILSKFDKAALKFCYVAANGGFFPIHTAAKEGHVRIIKEFLKHCPDSIELLNNQCQNILHVAAENGKSKVVKYLLNLDERKRMMNEQDSDGNTPLHLAAKHWHAKVTSMLTWSDGINLKTLNNDGFTALDNAEKLKINAYVLRRRMTWMALVSAGAQNGPKQIPFDKVSQSRIPNPDIYKDSVNTLMVTAALVATVTFTAGFTLPGGYVSSAQDLGMAALVDKMNFRVFLLFNSIAMCSSVVTIMALIWALLGDVHLTKKAFKLALPLLSTALVSMMMAFMAGVTLVVSNLPWLSHLVLAIDSVFFVVLMLLIIPYALSFIRQGFLRHIFYFPYFLMFLVVSEESDNTNNG